MARKQVEVVVSSVADVETTYLVELDEEDLDKLNDRSYVMDNVVWQVEDGVNIVSQRDEVTGNNDDHEVVRVGVPEPV